MSYEAEKKRHFIEYFIPFYLVLCLYKVGPFDLGSIGLAIAVVLDMAINKRPFKISQKCKPFAFLFGYVILRDFFKILTGREATAPLFNFMIYYSFMFLLIFLVCSADFDENILYRVWKVAALIYSIGLLYHLALIYLIGSPATPISIIPGYNLVRDTFAVSRPSSLFAEPASFAVAMLPLEFMALRRADYKWAVFATLFVLLSTSSIGVILSVVLWIATVLFSKIKLTQKILITILGGAFVLAFLNIGWFSASLEKVVEVADGESTVGSRVVSGFELIRTFDFSEFVLGTDFRQASSYVAANPEILPRDSHAYQSLQLGGSDFLNTFAFFIFSYGIVGLLLYLIPLVQWFFSNSKSRMYILMTLVAIFAQGALLNSVFFFTITILILFSEKETKRETLLVKDTSKDDIESANDLTDTETREPDAINCNSLKAASVGITEEKDGNEAQKSKEKLSEEERIKQLKALFFGKEL